MQGRSYSKKNCKWKILLAVSNNNYKEKQFWHSEISPFLSRVYRIWHERQTYSASELNSIVLKTTGICTNIRTWVRLRNQALKMCKCQNKKCIYSLYLASQGLCIMTQKHIFKILPNSLQLTVHSIEILLWIIAFLTDFSMRCITCIWKHHKIHWFITLCHVKLWNILPLSDLKEGEVWRD